MRGNEETECIHCTLQDKKKTRMIVEKRVE